MSYFKGLASITVVRPKTDMEGNDTASAEVNLVTRQKDVSDIAQTKKPGADTYCPDLSFSGDELEEIGEIRAPPEEFLQWTAHAVHHGSSKQFAVWPRRIR